LGLLSKFDMHLLTIFQFFCRFEYPRIEDFSVSPQTPNLAKIEITVEDHAALACSSSGAQYGHDCIKAEFLTSIAKVAEFPESIAHLIGQRRISYNVSISFVIVLNLCREFFTCCRGHIS